MRTLLKSGLVAALLLTGCHVAEPPTSAPAAPTTSPDAGVTRLNGAARYFGAPLAGATVRASLLGRGEVLATSTTDADGKFRLDFPASAPQGALVKLVATVNGVKIASMARVPMRQVLQATDGGLVYVIDEARSMVFLALGPRFEALGELSLGQDGVVALSVAEEGFQAFTTALEAAASAPPVSREAYEAAGHLALSDDGRLVTTPAALQAIAQAVPPAVASLLIAQADKLAVVIRAEVAGGKPAPKGARVGALPLGGDQIAEPVFTEGDEPTEPIITAPAPTGVDPLPTPDASGALGIADGTVLDPTATPTISVEAP